MKAVRNGSAARACLLLAALSVPGVCGCLSTVRAPLVGPAPRIDLAGAARERLLAQIVDDPSHPELGGVMERAPWAYFLTLAAFGPPEHELREEMDPDFLRADLLTRSEKYRGVVIGTRIRLLKRKCYKVRLDGVTTINVCEGLAAALAPSKRTQPEYYIFQWVERDGTPPLPLMNPAFATGRFFKNRPYMDKEGVLLWVPIFIGPPPTHDKKELSKLTNAGLRKYFLDPFKGARKIKGQDVDRRPVIELTASGKVLLDGRPLNIDDLAAQLEKRKKTEPVPAIIVRSHPQAARLRLEVEESAHAVGIPIVIQLPVDARIVDSATGR